MTSTRRADAGIAIALAVLTVATRLPRLGRPRAFVFDEVYYVQDAAELLRHGVERGGVVHPPLGKWLIAAGIRVVGYTPVGWRSAALVASVAVTLLTWAAAREVTTGRWIPVAAGLFVVFDGIAFTTGRVGMLDALVAAPILAMLWLTLRAWRLRFDARAVACCQRGAALAAGVGIAVKWNAALVAVGCAAAFALLQLRNRSLVVSGRAVGGTAALFLLVPSVVYVGSYIPWFVNAERTRIAIDDCRERGIEPDDCDPSVAERVELFLRDQNRMADFHRDLRSRTNSNAAPARKWLTLDRPAVLFRKRCVEQLEQAAEAQDDGACAGAVPGERVEIVATPNPVVWYAGLVGTAWAIIAALRRRNRSRRLAAALVVGSFVVLQWGPWLVNPRHAYSFYLASIVPVLAVGLATAMDNRIGRRYVAPVLVGLAIVVFAYELPIWIGEPMPTEAIEDRRLWTRW